MHVQWEVPHGDEVNLEPSLKADLDCLPTTNQHCSPVIISNKLGYPGGIFYWVTIYYCPNKWVNTVSELIINLQRIAISLQLKAFGVSLLNYTARRVCIFLYIKPSSKERGPSENINDNDGFFLRHQNCGECFSESLCPQQDISPFRDVFTVSAT